MRFLMDTVANYINYVIMFAIVLGVIGFRLWQRRSVADGQDGPILSSGQMLGVGGLQSMARGKIADFSYNLLTNDSGRVMFYVDLGHNSWSHLVAFGDRSAISDTDDKASLAIPAWLEPASLEGDFPKYFHMYCNPEAQDTLRVVFAPDVMAQFVDFCRSYDFELYRDSLYLSRAQNASDDTDQTSMVTDVTNFLQKNANTLRRL